jgi:AcrR family transcriptional regulator
VLNAAMSLLTSKGLPAFNMNAVAALAAIDVPTVHRHFKDRAALLKELYRNVMAREIGEVFALIREVKVGEETDTIALVQRQIDRIVDMQLADKDLVVLRQSIRAIPELAEVDEQANEGITSVVEHVLRTQLPEMNARRARSVAMTIVHAGTAMVELCTRRPKDARDLAREIGVMIVGYVREIIAPPPGPPDKATQN